MLGFECDCSVDVDNAPTCWTSTLRRARKTHRCIECGRAIVPGERYEVYSGLSEGKPFRHKTCLGCYHIREHFCSHGYYVGDVVALVFECLGFNYTDDPDEWDQEDVDKEDEANRAYVLARQQSIAAAKGEEVGGG